VTRRPILVLAFLALAAGSAAADIDVEAGQVLKAKSTLLPEGEVETFSFDATVGTPLSFTLTAAKKSTVSFSLTAGRKVTLEGPDGKDVDIDPEVVSVTPKGVSVKGATLLVSGRYHLHVTANGTGDYSLSLSALPLKTFEEFFGLFPGAPHPFLFSAPPGSTVTLSAKGANGTKPAPHFGFLTGTGYALDLATQGKATSTSHTVAIKNIGGTGDLRVLVSNTGEAGDVVATAKIVAPKVKGAKLDVRGAVLGRPAGGETYVARAIGPAGGDVTVDSMTSDLAGASVSIPAGALTVTLPVSIGSAVTPAIPGRDDQAAGPAVDLRPSGTRFQSAVTVTLPFDLALLPANASANDIRVLIIEANGSSRTVTPLSVDIVNGTVTLATSGFSVCVPIIRSGIARIGLAPGGDEYWSLFLTYSMGQDLAANDSRSREYRLAFGATSFFGDGTVQVAGEERALQVDNPDDGQGGVSGVVNSVSTPQAGTGTWVYDADGRSIDITTDGGDAPVLRVSRDGSVLVGQGAAAEDTKLELDVLVRKDATAPTSARLAGSYHLVAIDVDGQTDGPNQPARIQPDHVVGTVVFDDHGGFKLTGTESKSRFDGGTGTWTAEAKPLAVTSTYTIDGSGDVLMTIPPQEAGDTGTRFRLHSGAETTFLLGTDDFPQTGTVFGIFLVRQGSGLSLKSLDGPYLAASTQVHVDTYTPNGSTVTVSDLRLESQDLSLTFSGTAAVTLTQTSHEVFRDPLTGGGVGVQSSLGSTPTTFSVDSKGTLKIVGPDSTGVGGVSANAMFGFFADDPKGTAKQHHLIGFFVKSAPANP
jgi:hypothetical protein